MGLAAIIITLLAAVILGVIAFFRQNALLKDVAKLHKRLGTLETKLQRPPLVPQLMQEKPASPEKPAERLKPEPVIQAQAAAPPAKTVDVEQAPETPVPEALPIEALSSLELHPEAAGALAAAERELAECEASQAILPEQMGWMTPPPAAVAPPATSAKKPTAHPKDMELVIGQRWMTWIGVGVLFLCAAFFLKYGFDKGWFRPSPLVQVTACALIGLGVVGLGRWMMRKGVDSLNQGLVGLGLGVMYLSFLAGSSGLYDPPVISKSWAFVFMVATTALGMGMAVRKNLLPVAILAVLGGILTPVMVSMDVDQRDALFTYLLILNVGVITASMFRRWRWPDFLACLGTVLLFVGWGMKYDPSAFWPPAIWAMLFVALFSLREWTASTVAIGAGAMGLVLMKIGESQAAEVQMMVYLMGVSGIILGATFYRREGKANVIMLIVTALLVGLTLTAWNTQGKEHLLLWLLGFFGLYMVPKFTRSLSVAMAMFLGAAALSQIQPAMHWFMLYILVVDLTVLIQSLWREQVSADALTAMGTAILFAMAYSHYNPENPLGLLAWLGGFFVIFLTLPFAQNICLRKPVALRRFVLALAGATYTVGLMWLMLYENFRFLLACLTLGLSAVYLMLSLLLRWRIPNDRRSEMACMMLSLILLTMAIPLYLTSSSVAMAWAIEAVALLYLGYLFAEPRVRSFSLGVLVMAGFWHGFSYPNPLGHSGQPDVLLQALLVGPAAWWAWALVHYRFRRFRLAWEHQMQVFLGLLGTLAVLILMHYHYYPQLLQAYRQGLPEKSLRGDIFPLLGAGWWWTLGMMAFLIAARRFKLLASSLLGGLCWLIAAVLILMSMPGWPAGYGLFSNPRFATAIGVLLLLVYYLRGMRKNPVAHYPAVRQSLVPIGYGVLGVLLWLLLSAEVYRFVYYQAAGTTPFGPGTMANLCLTITWGLYAIAVLMVGFVVAEKSVRLAGMTLLLITAGKLLFVDMAQSEELTRIVAFFVVGLAMLGAAWLYHRLEKRLKRAAPLLEEPAE